MKNLFFLLLLFGFHTTTYSQSLSKDSTKLIKAKGGKYYGGVFKLNEPEYFKSLFPQSIMDATSYRIANNIYEGLLKFEQKDLSLKLALAESFSANKDSTVYTFKLRKGVYFHDNKCFKEGIGREVIAKDVQYCFTLLCTPHGNNVGFNTFENILKGAKEYYVLAKAGTASSEVTGIKIIDRYTIELTLVRPNSNFLYILARPYTYIFPKEAYEFYQTNLKLNAVGTGPFTLYKIEKGAQVILKKNPNYYLLDKDSNRLPYLNHLTIQFIKSKVEELNAFKKNKLDMMYRLPTDYIIELEEDAEKNNIDYSLQRSPELATHYLGFNVNDSLFKNRDLRLALSYAINRKRILEGELMGEGYAEGTYGITPIDAFKDYDVKKINGIEYDSDKAKEYLNKAGYKSGADVPKITLQFNPDGERNTLVAEEIQKQLEENLNIKIALEVIPTTTLIENCVKGKNSIYLTAWMADYPDPENFLSQFYSVSDSQIPYPNMTRYNNPSFNKSYEAGMKASSKESHYKNLMKAEQLMMNDAPIIVIWYDEGYRLLHGNVNSFDSNAMEYRDFTGVYFSGGK